MFSKKFAIFINPKNLFKINKKFSLFHTLNSQLSATDKSDKIKTTKEDLIRKQQELMKRGLPTRKPIEGVKNVILVASGKGGVGKSTIATNLAVGLKLENPQLDVGLLDADVFGPSIPLLMNLNEEPELDSNNLIVPLQNYGVKCMSMGFLVKDSSPVIWRGLMVMQAIEKLVRGVRWSPLDILIVDMPPGTGDTQLSFAQTVLIDGAIIVTTPHKISFQDALKGYEMFRKTNVPIFGFVMNMSSFICNSCGNVTKMSKMEEIENKIKKLDSSIIGNVPFNMEISLASDEGVPIVLSKEESPQAKEFRNISHNTMLKLQEFNTLKSKN